MTKLILIRHGQSQWNLENRFTGFHDVGLTKTGLKEADKAAKLIKKEGIILDVGFTSFQRRAIKTLWLTLEGIDQLHIPVTKSWLLNERHYGALTGLNKQETRDKHGDGNSLRGILKEIFDVPDADIPGFEFPTGNPLLIEMEHGTLNITSARYLDESRAKELPEVGAKPKAKKPAKKKPSKKKPSKNKSA